MANNSDELNKAIQDLAEAQDLNDQEYRKQVDLWWQSLSIQEREMAFYAVSQRIHQGELVDKRSFRGVLYGTFGFGTEMYGVAMDCGYLAIHNAIVDGNEFMDMHSARELTVTKDGLVQTWPEINSMSILYDNGKLTIDINKGNPYV